MARVCVCVTVSGGWKNYFAARQALVSVLDRTPFDVFAAVGSGPGWLLPAHPRLQVTRVADPSSGEHRSAPFLRKFNGISAGLRHTDADYLVVLDADTVVTGRIDVANVERALDGLPLAMAEQTGIRGSAMGRAGFMDHYRAHTLAWIAPAVAPPRLERFRFFNSGVVLGARAEFERLTAWALDTIGRLGPRHEVGRHMIADQDYFQAWTNTLHPGSCRTLGWEWNHCEHWDEGFPRRGALICHFSNFCNGPTARTLARMAWARRPWTRT
jgi:hypothetical protein